MSAKACLTEIKTQIPLATAESFDDTTTTTPVLSSTLTTVANSSTKNSNNNNNNNKTYASVKDTNEYNTYDGGDTANDVDDNCDDNNNDDYDDDYYNNDDDLDSNLIDDISYENPYDADPEYYEFKLFHINDLRKICEQKVNQLCKLLNIKQNESIELIKKFKWNYYKLIDLYESDENLFKQNYLNDDNNNNNTSAATTTTKTINNVNNNNNNNKAQALQQEQEEESSVVINSNLMLLLDNGSSSCWTGGSNSIKLKSELCTICYENKSDMDCLDCKHLFCTDCWRIYFEQLIQKSSTCLFECMNSKCKVIANEDFVLKQINKYQTLCERYKKLILYNHIKLCDDLQQCPGPECDIIVWARALARRVFCDHCSTQFCFMCTFSYHAPNSCDTIRKWYTKCQDDSETRNYLLVHTQDCPACKVCIEKNGGCAHMTCNRCKHEFCWVCLNDWKTHGASYDCNRYKANPTQDQAREALNRYTHYYHRWINHANSLKFEKAYKEQFKTKINEKVMNGSYGTLVDWEFLTEAVDVLTKARYTLQYTYPYAYYLENNEAKMLFENIQAELEKEVENLSHSLEKVNLNDKYFIKTQMTIVEKRRKTLLRDFIN